jgi:outer membrane protein assembly factor BamB
MATRSDTLFIGIRGTVLALDRATGATQWSAHLVGSDFVNVALQDGDVYAATRGRLYRLDPATGDILWSNELPGLGWGIITIAGAEQAAPSAEKRRRDQQAAAAASA